MAVENVQGVEVVVQIAGEDALAGRLWFHHRRQESATFSYESSYLARSDAYELDPQLPLLEGPYQTASSRAMFGAFTDCAPDRWGRRLIHRSEAKRAKREGTAERSYLESDYLLGVRDDLRQGALRFRSPDTGIYFAQEEEGVPFLIDLGPLLDAAEALERDEADEEELRVLLRGGSSLGGARPKAHVIDINDRIAIAKFPSPTKDEWDVMRWEAVALELARRSEVTVVDWRLETIDDKPVLISDRFDRVGERRVGYVSAMTMLEATDGDQRSYLEIADAIERYSPQARADLHELWRRIAFSILISNTDDHLRNHGFLRSTTAGWSLSPAFDLNPQPGPDPKELATMIDFDSAEARIDTLMSVADEFRLSQEEAGGILGRVVDATANWHNVAAELGVAEAEIERMTSAFEHSQRQAAEQVVTATAAP